MRKLLPFLLLASTFCLAIGLTQPLVRLDRLYFFTQQPSLTEIVAGLWQDSEFLLAIVVGLFSIVFPIAKLAVLHVLAFGVPEGSSREPPMWLKTLGKWSMLDVLLVAVIVFAAKTSGLATALTQPGLWFFGASTLLSSVAASYLK